MWIAAGGQLFTVSKGEKWNNVEEKYTCKDTLFELRYASALLRRTPFFSHVILHVVTVRRHEEFCFFLFFVFVRRFESAIKPSMLAMISDFDDIVFKGRLQKPL